MSKTYADIVKSKSSQVYSNGNITKANNITQGVNLSVNRKDTQSRVHTHKTKQGVNTQGDDSYDVNIGNIPHVLPVKGHYQKAKTCKYNILAVKITSYRSRHLVSYKVTVILAVAREVSIKVKFLSTLVILTLLLLTNSLY